MDTLVLNKNWQPDRVIGWKTAMTLIYSDRVEVIEYDQTLEVKSPSQTFRVPSVIRFKTGKTARFCAKLSRRMLFLRDQGQCQYCSKEMLINNFTVDHVVPRSKMGKTSWDNVVVSCNKCNSKKGDRTPEEAGLVLKRKPQRPMTRVDLIRQEIKQTNKWEKYV